MLGAVALVGALPFRVARLGGGLDALRDNDVLMAALRGPVGVSTAVTANALLVVAVLVDRRAPRWLALLFAVVALAGFSIEGHTRATGRRWAMVGSDIVHLGAGAVWLGGIVALVVAFRSSLDTGTLAGIVRRFSDSALLAVGVVAVTGVLMAWIILPTAGELTSTGYGLALLLKVALVLVVVAIGAYNRYRLVPAVDSRQQEAAGESRRAEHARRWLGTLVLAELVVLVLAVGVTAVMVTRSPLSSVAAAPTQTSQTLTVPLGDTAVAAVTVAPATVGFNNIDVEIRRPRRADRQSLRSTGDRVLVAGARCRPPRTRGARPRNRSLPSDRRPRLRRDLGPRDPSANGRVRVGFRGRHDHGRVTVAAERQSARAG